MASEEQELSSAERNLDKAPGFRSVSLTNFLDDDDTEIFDEEFLGESKTKDRSLISAEAVAKSRRPMPDSAREENSDDASTDFDQAASFQTFSNPLELGRAFAEMREEAGLTQTDVVNLAKAEFGEDLSRSTVFRLEAGKNMRMDHVFCYAKVLKFSLGGLFLHHM